MIHLTAIHRKYSPQHLAALVATTDKLRREIELDRMATKRVIHVEASERFRAQGSTA